MKRNEFLKKLGLGLGAALIAPSVIPSSSEKEIRFPEPPNYLAWKNPEQARKYPMTYDECYRIMEARLYYRDKEVYYKGYSRQDVRVTETMDTNSITLKPDSFSFPPAPKKKDVRCDCVKLFHKGQETVVFSLGEKWFGKRGILTLQW